MGLSASKLLPAAASPAAGNSAPAAGGAGGSDSPGQSACCFGWLASPARLANGKLTLETGCANLVMLALATGGPNLTDIGKPDLETGGPTTVNGAITDNGNLAASAEGT